MHTTHNLGCVVDASYTAEQMATGKAGEALEFAREIEIGLGVPPTGPTIVLTDNKANAIVGSGQGTARARHAIRRYVTFLQRVQSNMVKLLYVPDDDNPADFLTKPVPREKLERSVAWVTGAR